MAQTQYRPRELKDKHSKKGKKSLNAQEMAVMTMHYGENAFDDTYDDSGNDIISLDDSTSVSEKAKGYGFFSWAGGLFSKDIAFFFHGTQIKGKDRHQVRGGPVALFDGAVLDLTPASMTGAVEKDRQSVYPKKDKGTPAKLVLSPKKSGFITEHTVDDFVIKAPKNGEADVFHAKIERPLSYDLGDGRQLNARGATVDKEAVHLNEPRLGNGNRLDDAVINKDGIMLAEDLTSGTETREEPDTGTVSDSASSERELSADSGNAESENERTFIDLEKGRINIAGEDQGFSADAQTGDVALAEGDAAFFGNVYKKTFLISWGKLWSSDDDEDEEEKDDNGEEMPGSVKAAVKKYYEEFEKNIAEVLEDLGIAKTDFLNFIETGEIPQEKEDAESDGENENGSQLALEAVGPILPGVSFVASLEPSWSFGFKFHFGVQESKEAPALLVETETNGDGTVSVKSITYPDIKRDLILTAVMAGQIGATLRLALSLGAGYIFCVQGGLFATGEAKGILEGVSENAFGKGELIVPITIASANKKIKLDNASLKLNAGIGIFGSVGADIKAMSKLFDWENELYSITFKEWNPANFEGALDLKQNKGKGSLLNPKSWEIEQSKFSIQLFKTHIEQQKKYGLVMTDATPVNQKADESRALKDRIAGVHERLAVLEQQISAGMAGGQFAAEESEAYNSLVQELSDIREHLSFLILAGYNKLGEVREAVLNYKKDKNYIKNMNKVQAGITKHEKRRQVMMDWGSGFGEGEDAQRNSQAYVFYEDRFNAKGAARQRENSLLEEAKARTAKKEAVIAYEKERIRILGQKHDERIAMLEQQIQKMDAAEKNEPNPQFTAAYNAMGAKALLKDSGKYAGKERVIAYEQARMEKYGKRHKERVELLEKKLSESGISGENMNKSNRQFAEYYYKELQGRRFFSTEQYIYNHQNGADIVAYEKNRLMDKAGKSMEHIERLEYLKSRYEAEESSQSAKNAVLKEAQQYYAGTGTGRLGHMFQKKTDIAKSASKQDILDYEVKRLGEYNTGKGKEQKSFALEKEVLSMLSGVSVTGVNFDQSLTAKLKDRKYQAVWKIYRDWINGQDENTIKDMISLSVILDYELGKVKGEGADSAKHKGRYHKVGNTVLTLQKEQDEEKAAEITNKEKEEYFNNAQGLLNSVKKGNFEDIRLLKAVLQNKMEGYKSAHKDRLAKLCEFMGLENDSTDANASGKSDAQVWEYYTSIGAGDGFAKDYALRKKEFTIDDMLRYERYNAREQSRTNSITAAVSDKIESKIADYTTSEGGAGVEQRNAQLRQGGHYERYLKLKEKLDSGASDKEIVDLYVSMGGGSGYVKSRRKGNKFLDEVTPQEIMNYEQNRNGKKGEKHKARLEMLNSLDDSLSSEEVYEKYHEMTLEGSFIKKAEDKTGVYKKTGFDKSVHAGEVLTPEMILDYEIKRKEELTAKHTERMERLNREDVTDENVLSIYKELGGGEGFFDANKEQISLHQSQIGDSRDFQNIIDYEQMRIAYYQNIMDEINEPLKRIDAAQEELQKQLDKAQEDKQQIMKYLGASGQRQVFSGHDAFVQFTEETTGDSAQNNAEESQASVDAALEKARTAHDEAQQIIKKEPKLLGEDEA